MFQLARKCAVPLLNSASRLGLFRLAVPFFAGRGVIFPFFAGRGVIFSLHRVLEPGHTGLHPIHQLSSSALEDLLLAIRHSGWRIVGIDEVWRILTEPPERTERFACFAFDDGYADTLTVALPMFRKHQAPFCVYVTTGMVERQLFYWWGANHELVLTADRLELPSVHDGAFHVLPARSLSEKCFAYRTLDGLCHRYGHDFTPVLLDLYKRWGVNEQRILDREALTVSQLNKLAGDPLVTIGSHSVTHQRLLQMEETRALWEMETSRRTIEGWLDRPVRHFSYPFGRADACGPREVKLAEQAGYRTGVTTRQGNIFPEHRNHLCALPRRPPPITGWKTQSILSGVQSILEHERKFQIS